MVRKVARLITPFKGQGEVIEKPLPSGKGCELLAENILNQLL